MCFIPIGSVNIPVHILWYTHRIYEFWYIAWKHTLAVGTFRIFSTRFTALFFSAANLFTGIFVFTTCPFFSIHFSICVIEFSQCCVTLPWVPTFNENTTGQIFAILRALACLTCIIHCTIGSRAKSFGVWVRICVKTRLAGLNGMPNDTFVCNDITSCLFSIMLMSVFPTFRIIDTHICFSVI